MAEIGAEAAAARPIDPALVQRLLAASAKAPLAPEPFLVRGVEAQVAGDQQLAQRAFLAARERSPRSVAARYFLADHYLKAGQVVSGLAEISVLVRLVPQSLPNIGPMLAEFARSPGAAPQAKAFLETHPQLEPALLDALATDAANADLVLALWSGRGGEEAKPWQARLLNQLVQAGRYGQARESWRRFTGSTGKQGQLLDPDFGNQGLPPFGWKLASDPAGIAESESDGRLHVLFYGRDNLVLASQLLTLEPGQYSLSMKADFASPESKLLDWTVKCLPSSTAIAVIPIDRAGMVSASFSVPPANCEAQSLELGGIAAEIAAQSDVTISHVLLRRDAGT